MAYDPEYYKQYYKARKEKILADKKRRYETDARYRGGVQQKARVSSLLRTMKSRELKKAARVVHNGRPEHFYYVTTMLPIVNRDRSVIDKWIHSYIIPPPSHRDRRGRRLYSESQVRFLASLLHKLDHGKASMTYTDMSYILRDVWGETFSEKLLVKTVREVLHGKYYKEGEGRKVRKGKKAD